MEFVSFPPQKVNFLTLCISMSHLDKLPYCVRVLLESAIRNCDGLSVPEKTAELILDWGTFRTSIAVCDPLRTFRHGLSETQMSNMFLANCLRKIDAWKRMESDVESACLIFFCQFILWASLYHIHVANTSKTDTEVAFKPARVILQDFTGVPAVVDLAAMRDATKRLGSDPAKINPHVPVDLVVDHSVQVRFFSFISKPDS